MRREVAAVVSRYRADLPQLHTLLLTDGGLETWLIEDAGQQLADFAAFPLLRTSDGRRVLQSYYRAYLELAARDGVGIVLDTPTWRASPDWGARLGYDRAALAEIDREAVALLAELRQQSDPAAQPVVISGCIGPRSDDVPEPDPDAAARARDYHAAEVEAFADTEADLVTAMTLSTAEEAIGIALAARAVAVPVAISFTTGADGRLPSGATIAEAITIVDEHTDGWPAYYLINCAHPSQFVAALDAPVCRTRVRGARANATALGSDEPSGAEELAGWYVTLRAALPNLTVAGGCCGTDHRHVAAISAALHATG